MNKARLIIALISGAIIVADLFLIDYSNLWSRPNLGPFLTILACGMNIGAMVFFKPGTKDQTSAE